MDLLQQLMQFALRLSFGLGLGMAITSPRLVTSGYFRNTTYVLLGLNVLASLVAFGGESTLPAYAASAAAVISYVGSVLWMYEKHWAGRISLILIAGLSLLSAYSGMRLPESGTSSLANVLAFADAPTGGAVLGITMAAMLLGHWYLNSPRWKSPRCPASSVGCPLPLSCGRPFVAWGWACSCSLANL